MKLTYRSNGRVARAYIAGALAVVLGGCATLGVPSLGGNGTRTQSYPTVSDTVKQGCLGGAVLGVAYSELKGGEKPATMLERITGATKSAAVGAGIGCTAAYALDLRRARSSDEADFYEKEIQITRAANGEMINVNAHLSKRMAASRAELAELERSRAAAELDLTDARQARDTARADLGWARSQLETARTNLDSQKKVLAESGGRASPAQARKLGDEVAALEAYVATLEREVGDLASISDSIGQFRG